MNLDHDFLQVIKLSEDQKRSSLKMEHFSPNSGEDQKKQKKRSSPKVEQFFSPNSSAEIPPGFGTPDYWYSAKASSELAEPISASLRVLAT